MRPLHVIITGGPAADITDLDDDQRGIGCVGRRRSSYRGDAALYRGHGTDGVRVPQGHELLPPSGERAQAPGFHHSVCIRVL